MHRQTRLVMESIGLLEFEQFRHPNDRDRLMAIRELAIQQVRDDTSQTTPEHHGRHDMVMPMFPDAQEVLWRKWTPEQVALEAGMLPFLQQLTEKQQETLHLLFRGRLTTRQAAVVQGIDQKQVRQRRDRALATLQRLLLVAFPEEVNLVALDQR